MNAACAGSRNPRACARKARKYFLAARLTHFFDD
jgi:hypothetical protein